MKRNIINCDYFNLSYRSTAAFTERRLEVSVSVHRGRCYPSWDTVINIYSFLILALNVRGHMIDWFTSLKRELLFRITHLNVQLGLLLFLMSPKR